MKASELEAIGFVEAGACVLDSALKSGVRFALSTHKKDRVLYAFVVQHEVMYIGSCDNARTCFASRVARYQGIMGAGTNKRVVGFLREVLSKGHLVRSGTSSPSHRLHRMRG